DSSILVIGVALILAPCNIQQRPDFHAKNRPLAYFRTSGTGENTQLPLQSFRQARLCRFIVSKGMGDGYKIQVVGFAPVQGTGSFFKRCVGIENLNVIPLCSHLSDNVLVIVASSFNA